MNDYQDTPTVIGSRGGNRGTTNAAAIKAAKRSGEYNAVLVELGSNTFLRLCPSEDIVRISIHRNDESIDRCILPRTTAFPQCTLE